jgi:hypothetical protein
MCLNAVDDVHGMYSFFFFGLVLLLMQMHTNAGRSRVQILYSPRDYRAEGTSSSELKEISVKQYTEIVFQPLRSKKARKFKLSNVVSVTLSA